MNPDFHSAAHRHWNDAEFLHCDSRLGNAYQLYGLAAECALKAVMQGLGMQLGDKGRPQEPGHKVHIDKLWQAFSLFAPAEMMPAMQTCLTPRTRRCKAGT